MGQSRRLMLQSLLEEILGSQNVYFQPPKDATMQYPCIVYERDIVSKQAADDQTYNWTQGYQVTYIDPKPDSDVIDKLMVLPLSSFRRHFATSGLNHDVFVIYH